MKLLQKKHELFMVPLKDLVVFPRMVVPFLVGRRRSVRSVEEAARLGRPLFLAAQKKTAVEEYTETRECLQAVVRTLPPAAELTPQISALMRTVLTQFHQYNEVAKKV